MLRSWSIGACTGLILSGAAIAQTPPTAARIACDKYAAPAFAKDKEYAKGNLAFDCACVSGFLIGRYGAAEAEIIVRIFAAAAVESAEQAQAVATEFGPEAMKKLIAKVGKFQDVGREMDKACPAIRKP